MIGKHKCLKIALMIPTLTGGGAERVMVNLANQYAEYGHKVWLLTTREGDYFEFVNPHVRLRILPFLQRFSLNLLYLVPFLILHRPHVLMSTLETANIFGPIAAKLSFSRTKIIIREANTLHRFRQETISRKQKSTLHKMKFSYSLADGIIANSQSTAKDLETYGLLGSKPLRTISNPVYSDKLSQAAEGKSDHQWVESHIPYILTVGRLDIQKDQKALIKAVSLLRKHHEIKLIILGTGPEEQNLLSLAEEQDLSEHISLPGFVQNPYPFYKNAKLFCLSSRWEGFGNVLIEALAFGLPIVSTDCPGGPRWILNDGKYGHLVPVGDSERLAEAMKDVLDTPERFRKEDQIERAKEYSIERIADKYLEFMCSAEKR